MNSEVYSALLRTFGTPKATNHSTGQISFDCPNCDNGRHKGNLEVNIEKNVYSCWACRENYDGVKGRDILRLIRKYGSKEDYKFLREIMPQKVYELPVEVAKNELGFPKEFISFEEENSNKRGFKTSLEYLKLRKVSQEKAIDFGLGYCIDGKYAGRIIIPSFDEFGEIDYFTGRDFTDKSKIKYLSPSIKEQVCFNLGRINFDQAVFIVEGPFDHLALQNSIPLLGKSPSDLLIKTLQNRLLGNLFIALDGDAYETALKLKFTLDYGNLKGKIYILKIEEHKDIASIYAENDEANFYKIIKSAILKNNTFEI